MFLSLPFRTRKISLQMSTVWAFGARTCEPSLSLSAIAPSPLFSSSNCFVRFYLHSRRCSLCLLLYLKLHCPLIWDGMCMMQWPSISAWVCRRLALSSRKPTKITGYASRTLRPWWSRPLYQRRLCMSRRPSEGNDDCLSCAGLPHNPMFGIKIKVWWASSAAASRTSASNGNAARPMNSCCKKLVPMPTC